MKKIICTLFFVFCLCFTVQARELPTQENTSPNKIWTVTFTRAMDKSTVNQITVEDSYGNNIDIDRRIVDDKTVTIEPTDGAWGRGITYTMKIGDVKSAKGQLIKEHSTKKFITGGTDFVASGTYKNDEIYLYENMSKILWNDGDNKKQVNCYAINIFDDNTGGITVAFYTDTWSAQQIMSSPTSAQSIKLQIETAYNYIKAKYTNRDINVGLFYREWLNKKIDGYNNLELVYDAAAGKYKLMFLLGAKYPDGKEFIVNGGN